MQQLLHEGKAPAQQLNRARILHSHQSHEVKPIIALLDVSQTTVYNVRHRYRNQALAKALQGKPRNDQPHQGHARHKAYHRGPSLARILQRVKTRCMGA